MGIIAIFNGLFGIKRIFPSDQDIGGTELFLTALCFTIGRAATTKGITSSI
jgi:hypothetical protein